MHAFDFVMTLLSFVYALAITHLLYCTAQCIRGWRRLRISWPHASWMFTALMVIVANWISYWDLRTIPAWSIGMVLFTFLMAFVNYIQAALVCPEIRAEGSIDLAAFHKEHGRQYIAAALASIIFALVANIVYGTQFSIGEWGEQNRAVIPMFAVALAATIWRKRWIDWTAAVLMLLIWGYYFASLQSALR